MLRSLVTGKLATNSAEQKVYRFKGKTLAGSWAWSPRVRAWWNIVPHLLPFYLRHFLYLTHTLAPAQTRTLTCLSTLNFFIILIHTYYSSVVSGLNKAEVYARVGFSLVSNNLFIFPHKLLKYTYVYYEIKICNLFTYFNPRNIFVC